MEAAAFFANEAQCITLIWEDIQAEVAADQRYQELLVAIRVGFLDLSCHAVAMAAIWPCRHGLYELDGVAIYQNHVVMPDSGLSSWHPPWRHPHGACGMIGRLLAEHHQ